MCTLRNFPSIIIYCIEWSRDVFNEYFISNVSYIKKFFTDFDGFKESIKKEGSWNQNLEKLIVTVRNNHENAEVYLNSIKIFEHGKYQGQACIVLNRKVL